MARAATYRDHVVEDPMLRLREVEDMTGLRKSAIYARMKLGTFPKAHKPGGGSASRWPLSVIVSWRDADKA